MRRIVFLVLSALMIVGAAPSTSAFDDHSFEAVAADVVVVRPVSFAATIIGTALFLVALPVAAISKSTSETAEALVVRPARMTFSRPLGELSTMGD